MRLPTASRTMTVLNEASSFSLKLSVTSLGAAATAPLTAGVAVLSWAWANAAPAPERARAVDARITVADTMLGHALTSRWV